MTQDSLKIYIEKALKLKFKALCAMQDRDMSEVASGLIEGWVKQNEAPPQQDKWKSDRTAANYSQTVAIARYRKRDRSLTLPLKPNACERSRSAFFPVKPISSRHFASWGQNQGKRI